MSRPFIGSMPTSRPANGHAARTAAPRPVTPAAPARPASSAKRATLTPQQEILARVACGDLMPEEAARLLGQAKPVSTGGLSIRVSPKRAVSVYGLQRMPITLYATQWLRLIEIIKEGKLEQFIEQHRNELSWGKEQATQ
jgi:hypothetical protein